MISFNNIGNLGRLANQMFQYASLKGIARNRGFEFTIPPEDVFGQNDPLVKTSPLNIYNVFENISNNKIEIQRNPMLQERMHEFDEELFRSCPDNVDLFGYFQSPKYFNHIKDEIKNDFKFTNEVESLCDEMYESISGKKVVSLHIRRTDYLKGGYTGKDIPIDIVWLNRNHNYSSTHLKAEIYNSVKYRKDRELRFD